MFITTTTHEFRMILERAILTGASYISFLNPDEVLIVHENQSEYTFMKTTAFIPNSCMLDAAAIQNLWSFLARIKRNKKETEKEGMKGMAISITPDFVRFDNHPLFTYEFNTNLIELPGDTVLKNYTSRINHTSYDESHPFLRLTSAGALRMKKQMKANNKLNRDTTHEYLTEMWVDGFGNLAGSKLSRKGTGDHSEAPPGDVSLTDGFHLKGNENQTFYLFQIDLDFIKRMTQMRMVDNIFIFPFKDFYIMEMHADQMIFKTHMKTSLHFEKNAADYKVLL